MSTLLRRVRRHRRLLIAALVFVAAWAILASLRSAPSTVTVAAAARDLPAGAILTASDLTTTPMLSDSVTVELRDPDAAIGRVLLAPLHAREPLSATRLLDARNVPAGHAFVPVVLSQPELARMLRSGDRIDVISAHGVSTAAHVVAVDVSGNASTILVDVPEGIAAGLAASTAQGAVSATLRSHEGGSS